MSNYTSTYPTDTKVDPGIKTFFEEFYKISDTPNAHDLYAQQFTKDAVLVMASKRCEGSDAKADMAKEEGKWKMKFYQVYLDLVRKA
ncbi:hypothetical protein M7I_4966 [Glarea lozoyensis 74030]|uniref:SnoaL-like domain-containing protein n=1 Tax=Glarea lozoyensis (strain ATCC 74030 / MF5533) TaxID=1104152 RepID=H0EQL2_GLAL7|nr:hypothetical protein M7I_4966 [Glarea lozoyensis 74030]